MPSCVLAYSGGLDTSVILGWLQDEGYDVHAVYVDLGQPCEDREAILKKARDCGAESARIVDAREELCRDFAFPGAAVAGEVRGHLSAGHVDRPAADLEGLPAGGPRSRGRRRTPTARRARGTTSAASSSRPRRSSRTIKIIAPWRIEEVPRQVSRPHAR